MAAQQFGPHNFQVGNYYEISTMIYLNGARIPQHIYGRISEVNNNEVVFGVSKVVNDPNNLHNRRLTFNYESQGGSRRRYVDMLSVNEIGVAQYSQIPPVAFQPANANIQMNIVGGKRRLRKTRRASKKQRKHKKRVHTKRR